MGQFEIMGDAASNYWRGLLAASRDKVMYKPLDRFLYRFDIGIGVL